MAGQDPGMEGHDHRTKPPELGWADADNTRAIRSSPADVGWTSLWRWQCHGGSCYLVQQAWSRITNTIHAYYIIFPNSHSYQTRSLSEARFAAGVCFPSPIYKPVMSMLAPPPLAVQGEAGPVRQSAQHSQPRFFTAPLPSWV